MLTLNHFCDLYDVPKTTALDWIFKYGMPAIKLGRQWRVDMTKIEKWFEKTHKQCYKYAD